MTRQHGQRFSFVSKFTEHKVQRFRPRSYLGFPLSSKPFIAFGLRSIVLKFLQNPLQVLPLPLRFPGILCDGNHQIGTNNLLFGKAYCVSIIIYFSLIQERGIVFLAIYLLVTFFGHQCKFIPLCVPP